MAVEKRQEEHFEKVESLLESLASSFSEIAEHLGYFRAEAERQNPRPASAPETTETDHTAAIMEDVKKATEKRKKEHK